MILELLYTRAWGSLSCDIQIIWLVEKLEMVQVHYTLHILDMSLSHPFSDMLTHGHFYFWWPFILWVGNFNQRDLGLLSFFSFLLPRMMRFTYLMEICEKVSIILWIFFVVGTFRFMRFLVVGAWMLAVMIMGERTYEPCWNIWGWSITYLSISFAVTSIGKMSLQYVNSRRRRRTPALNIHSLCPSNWNE